MKIFFFFFASSKQKLAQNEVANEIGIVLVEAILSIRHAPSFAPMERYGNEVCLELRMRTYCMNILYDSIQSTRPVGGKNYTSAEQHLSPMKHILLQIN